MKIVTVSSKNQITLPQEMLLTIGLNSYRKLILENQTDRLVLKPLTDSMVEQTAGSLTQYVSPNKMGKSFKEIMRQTRKRTAEKLAKK